MGAACRSAQAPTGKRRQDQKTMMGSPESWPYVGYGADCPRIRQYHCLVHRRQRPRGLLRSRRTVRESVMAQSINRIINALPQNIFAAVEPHLKAVTLTFGDVL